jgi:hypothetical protein
VLFFFNGASRYEVVLGEWKYSSMHSLTSALDGGEWSASRPGRFAPRERAPGTHWIGGCMGPGAILDAVARRKLPSPRRDSKPRTPIVQPVARGYTDWAITALGCGACSWNCRKGRRSHTYVITEQELDPKTSHSQHSTTEAIPTVREI